MLYLFHGSDEVRVRQKAFAWILAARTKEPNISYIHLAREELSAPVLEDIAAVGGLFVSRLLVLLDDPYPGARARSEEEDDGAVEDAPANLLNDYLDSLAASDNVILILAPGLPSAHTKKLIPKLKKEYRFDREASRETVRGFNSALVNALAARSREKVWLEIVRALREGDAPEAIHGLLHWKARDLMEKKSRAWPEAEARRLSRALIRLLTDARRRSLDLAASLERFALEI